MARLAITTYAYDAAGNLTSLTDPLGKTTSYTYNGLSQQTQETFPAGQTLTTTYDSNGRVASTTNARGHQRTYTYKAWGDLNSITEYSQTALQTAANNSTDPVATRTLSFTYDLNGNQLSSQDSSIQSGTLYTHTYDKLNRPQNTTIGYLSNATIKRTHNRWGDLTNKIRHP